MQIKIKNGGGNVMLFYDFLYKAIGALFGISGATSPRAPMYFFPWGAWIGDRK